MPGDDAVPLLVHRSDGSGIGSTNGKHRHGEGVNGSHEFQSASRRVAGGGWAGRRRLLLWLVPALTVGCCLMWIAFQLVGGSSSCEQRYSTESSDAAASDRPLVVPHGSSRQRFSSYDCLAGHSTPGLEGVRDSTVHSRMCLFRDVCLDRQRQLFYYSDPALPPEPLRVDSAIHTAFPPRLVNLRRYLPAGQPGTGHAFFTAHLTRSAIPADAVWAAASAHALYHQFWPENFGHVLGDDVYPVWQQLRRFGVSEPRDVQVLGWLPCEYSGKDDGSRQRACDNTHGLFQTISDRPWQHVDAFFAAHHANASGDADDAALVCVEQLVVGHGLNGMYWQGRDWPLFIDHVTRHFAPDTRATRPQQLSILVTRKTNRRRIVNFDAVVAYLRRAFDVPVDVWEPHTLPFEEQVRRVRSYPVLVTPCGGISFVSPFMAAGSSAVYVDFFDARWNTTAPMEEYVWQHDPRLARYHYHIRRDDIRGLDEEAMRRDGVEAAGWDEKRLWRNYPLLHVEPVRMAYFVMHALRRAATRLGLPDTLNYTRLLQLTDNFSSVELDDGSAPSEADSQPADGVEDDAEAAARQDSAAVDSSGEGDVQRVAQLTAAATKASWTAPHCGLPVYYWTPGKGRQNFGDVLGVVLVRLLTRFDPRVRLTNLASASPKLTTVGSVADTARPGDWVWSSGVHPWAHAALAEHRPSARNFSERYGAVHVAATRGPRSRQFLLDATNQSLPVPEVFGDGALLLPLFFGGLREDVLSRHSQRNNLTRLVLVIPHMSDHEAVRQQLARDSSTWARLNYRLVSVLDPWEAVLPLIAGSSLVLASSLHGVIVAESFGVGARLFRTKSSEGAFKYRDYYEGTGRFGVNLTLSLDEALRLGAEEPIGAERLRSIQRGLLNSFPKQLWDDCLSPSVLFNLPLPPT